MSRSPFTPRKFAEPHIRQVEESLSAVLERAAQPSEAQRAIKEVIVAMVGDARRAAGESRAQLDRLADILTDYENHLAGVVDDFATRIATVQSMYSDLTHRLITAQKAIYAAPLTPPAPPPDLAEEPPRIAADHETTGTAAE